MIDFIFDHSGMIGLLFFFCTFTGVAVWCYAPSQRHKLENYKLIPLMEDQDDR